TPESAELPLSHYCWILQRHRWRIGGFVAAVVLFTYVLCNRITPMYEATATIEFDRQSPTGVVGQEASQLAVNDADQFLATQVRMLQSDSVLRPVVRKLALAPDPKVADMPGDAPVRLKGLRVSRPPNTYLLQVGYRSSDPKQAAAVANGVASSYIDYSFTG